ncbi:unnamed protein product [Caenorhabditis bovis]|uniref:Uncharacterized protein n=1 Tax=Caenorhabditis bovis TaxID=2654633 RepID=A0A8S1FF16_9PELO|nr:unnamed protein product [Caenorhabditis bovis]
MREKSLPEFGIQKSDPTGIFSEEFNERLANLLPAEELREPEAVTSKAEAPPFAATVFIEFHGKVAKFGLALTTKNDILHIIIYDGSKQVLLHVDTTDKFILSNGVGEPISYECSVLYDTVKHKKEDGEMKIPQALPNIKCKMSSEKSAQHPLHAHFIGLAKSANLLVRTAPDTVMQVYIRKIKFKDLEKKGEDSKEPSEEPEETRETQTSLKERISKIGKSIFPVEGQSKMSEVEAECATETLLPSDSTNSAPLPSLSAAPELDLYATIHRIVGVEIDRMQLRMDAKFESFKNEVLLRLDRQNELLEKIASKNS